MKSPTLLEFSREIIRAERDEMLRSWVAELSCGHSQKVFSRSKRPPRVVVCFSCWRVKNPASSVQDFAQLKFNEGRELLKGGGVDA